MNENPYASSSSTCPDDVSLPTGVTRVFLYGSVVLSTVLFVLFAAAVYQTGRDGPLPPPTRYGFLHFGIFGAGYLLPFAFVWAAFALSRRDVWPMRYRWLAFLPALLIPLLLTWTGLVGAVFRGSTLD